MKNATPKIGDRVQIKGKRLNLAPWHLVGMRMNEKLPERLVSDIILSGVVHQVYLTSFVVKYDHPFEAGEYREFPLPIPEHILIIPSQEGTDEEKLARQILGWIALAEQEIKDDATKDATARRLSVLKRDIKKLCQKMLDEQ